jgi:hypothetical protein
MRAWAQWRSYVRGGLAVVALSAPAFAVSMAASPAGAVVAASGGTTVKLSGAVSGTLHDGPEAGCPYGGINTKGFVELNDLVGATSGTKGVASFSLDINVKKNGTFKFKTLPIGDPNAELNVSLKGNNIAAGVKDNFFANGGSVTVKGEAGSLRATMSQAGGGKSLKMVAQWDCGAPAEAAAAAGAGWKDPIVVDHSSGATAAAFTGISCPTTSFCAAVEAKGNAVLYQNGKWTTPQSIDANTASNFNDSLGTVSCVSSSFCVAGDDLDDVYTYNGSSWSAATQLNPSMTSDSVSFAVSCPTASFCLGVDGDLNYYTYNGSSWSAVQVVDASSLEGIGLTEVSCASSTFCVLAMGRMTATYNGNGWSAPVTIGTSSAIPSGGTPGIEALSCPSSTFCAGVGTTSDNQAYVDTFNGTSWAPGTIKKAMSGPQGFVSVSCPTTSFCMAPGLLGWVTWTGSAWSAPQTFTDPGAAAGEGPQFANAVSCASSTFCEAVSSNGYADEWKT